MLLFPHHTRPQDVLSKQMVYTGKSEQIQSKFYPQKGCLPGPRPNTGNWVLGPEKPVSVDFQPRKRNNNLIKYAPFFDIKCQKCEKLAFPNKTG